MSLNPAIVEKIKKHCKDDKVMAEFLLDVVNNEVESGNYSKKYKNLIEKIVDKGE